MHTYDVYIIYNEYKNIYNFTFIFTIIIYILLLLSNDNMARMYNISECEVEKVLRPPPSTTGKRSDKLCRG